jgi:hypothetical protein
MDLGAGDSCCMSRRMWDLHIISCRLNTDTLVCGFTFSCMYTCIYIYMYRPYLIVQVLFTFMISLSQSYFYQSIIQYKYIYISIYIDLCRYVYYRRKWRRDVEHVEPPDTPSTREAVARGAASAGFLGWKNAMGWRLNWISASYIYISIYIYMYIYFFIYFLVYIFNIHTCVYMYLHMYIYIWYISHIIQ